MKKKLNAAVVIVRHNRFTNKFLLLCFTSHAGHDFWCFPNDIILPGHTAHDTAFKLVPRQVGVHCRIMKEALTLTDRHGTELHIMLAEHIYGSLRPLHNVIKEVRWCTKEEIKTLLDAEVPDEVWQLLE